MLYVPQQSGTPPTNIVMFTGTAPACPWSGPLPSRGTHSFSVVDGSGTVTVQGYVLLLDPQHPAILIRYAPKTPGSCPAVTLSK